MRIYCDGSLTVYCFLPIGYEPIVYPNPAGVSHNVSEYMAILHAVIFSNTLGMDNVEIVSDSELAIKQINGEYKCKDPSMLLLRNMVLSTRTTHTFTHVKRELNLAGVHLEGLKQ